MNAIIGLSGLALQNEMPPRIQDYLRKIRKSGENLLGIINDILDFSKIESGKLEVEAVPFELEDVIDNVVTVLSEKVDAKGLELVCRLDPDIPATLVGDPLRIGQILINYANNAVKFTSHGEVQLNLLLREASAKQVLLEVQVCDTGIGLNEEQMGRLFKSFEQADSSITRQYGGTGLGLAISKSLALAMQGDVGVRSVHGQGSTFWFTVRLGVGTSDHPTAALPPGMQGLRVLVVDDNAAAAAALTDMLHAMGYAAQAVDSGSAALRSIENALAAQQAFDLVLVDWQMPGMDGLQTVRALQALLPGRAPHCVLMAAAHRRQELLRSAEEAGLADVLAKPVRSSALRDALLQAMGYAVATHPADLGAQANALQSDMATLRGARILLVEDNEINQQVAREMLENAGLLVEVADNGQIAVDRVDARFARQQPYDLVLMDMQMPVMDGVTATRLIRSRPAGSDLPIVAMTANAMAADRQRCLDAGMNGFVVKPINTDALWKTLLALVQLRAGMGASSAAPSARPAPAAQDQGLIQALRASHALDVDLGLMHTTNNPVLYASLLRKFVAAQEDAVQRMRASLDAADQATAERIAHTLKGVAGNLGATEVQHSADHLEANLRDGVRGEQLIAAIRGTDVVLGHLIHILKDLPGLVAPGPAVLPADLGEAERAQARALLQDIARLLAQDDASALDLWDANAALLRAVYADAGKVESAIAAFDFETALALLEGLALQ
jgi:CheY-like chemotaxis protein